MFGRLRVAGWFCHPPSGGDFAPPPPASNPPPSSRTRGGRRPRAPVLQLLGQVDGGRREEDRHRALHQHSRVTIFAVTGSCTPARYATSVIIPLLRRPPVEVPRATGRREQRPNGWRRGPPTRVWRREVAFPGARMRGARAAEPLSPRFRRAGNIGRAAKGGKQRCRLVSAARNRGASAPRRKAIDEGVAEGVMASML